MQHHTVEVVPYSPSYRVYDKDKAVFVKEFDTVEEAVKFVNDQPLVHPQQPRLSYTLKLEPEYRYTVYLGIIFDSTARFGYRRETQPAYAPAARWVILNEFGDIVSKEEVEDIRRRNYRRRYWRGEDPRYIATWERLVSVKGDAKKVKTNFVAREDPRDNGQSRSFSFKVWGYDRHIRTTNEIRTNEGHINEYGEEFVRGRRRKIPTAWEDIRSGRWDKRKSWKDSTKRRKQWVPK
jgi:hypothetical protein